MSANHPCCGCPEPAGPCCSLDGGTQTDGSWSYSAGTLTGSGVYTLSCDLINFDLTVGTPCDLIINWIDADNNTFVRLDSDGAKLIQTVSGDEVVLRDSTYPFGVGPASCYTFNDITTIRVCNNWNQTLIYAKDGDQWRLVISLGATFSIAGVAAGSSTEFSNLVCNRVCNGCLPLLDSKALYIDFGSASLGNTDLCDGCSDIGGVYKVYLGGTGITQCGHYCKTAMCFLTPAMFQARGCCDNPVTTPWANWCSGLFVDRIGVGFNIDVCLFKGPYCTWQLSVGYAWLRSSEDKSGTGYISDPDCTITGLGRSALYESECVTNLSENSWTLKKLSESTDTWGGASDSLCSGSFPDEITLSFDGTATHTNDCGADIPPEDLKCSTLTLMNCTSGDTQTIVTSQPTDLDRVFGTGGDDCWTVTDVAATTGNACLAVQPIGMPSQPDCETCQGAYCNQCCEPHGVDYVDVSIGPITAVSTDPDDGLCKCNVSGAFTRRVFNTGYNSPIDPDSLAGVACHGESITRNSAAADPDFDCSIQWVAMNWWIYNSNRITGGQSGCILQVYIRLVDDQGLVRDWGWYRTQLGDIVTGSCFGSYSLDGVATSRNCNLPTSISATIGIAA